MQYPKMYFYQRLVQAKNYIDEHFATPLDINKIADEASYSRFHFIRSFKIAFGYTPHKYLVHKRIAYAKKLLEEGKRVTFTCFEAGFESPGSFSTLFKQRTGHSPSSYQKAHFLKKKALIKKPAAFIPGCYAEK